MTKVVPLAVLVAKLASSSSRGPALASTATNAAKITARNFIFLWI